ncbi:hypothetical protein [Streptomyces sp. NBC_00885]
MTKPPVSPSPYSLLSGHRRIRATDEQLIAMLVDGARNEACS